MSKQSNQQRWHFNRTVKHLGSTKIFLHHCYTRLPQNPFHFITCKTSGYPCLIWNLETKIDAKTKKKTDLFQMKNGFANVVMQSISA